SMAIVLRELGEVYSARLDSTEARLESCDLRYVDYADWQSRLLESQEGERLLSYWQKQLLGAPTAIDFPADRPRPAIETHKGASRPFEITGNLALAFRAMARERGATLYMALLGAYGVLINRYTGQVDIVVGSPSAGRGRRD